MQRKVAIVQAWIPQYRLHFFEGLRAALSKDDIDLVLVYGDPHPSQGQRNDAVDLAWGTKVPTHYVTVGGRFLTWQSCLSLLADVDLVIVEQASRHLLNYVLMARESFGRTRVALWGHGVNLQSRRASWMAELVKRHLSMRAHWWFAYNDLSARIVAEAGYPRDRITSVQNAIDTSELVRWRAALDPVRVEQLRSHLGLPRHSVCVYAGGLHGDKDILFLLEAACRIRDLVPEFHLLVLGAGPFERHVRDAAHRLPWVHHCGPVFGVEKVEYFACSKLSLMPGMVGLGVLDAFALETPLVTRAVAYHSPEFAYLEDGVNGVVVSSIDVESYAQEVSSLLGDDRRLDSLIAGCRHSVQQYSLEAMVARFAEGISCALAS